jgi:phage tail-like protein
MKEIIMKRRTLLILLMSIFILTAIGSAKTSNKTLDVRARTVKANPVLTGKITVTSASVNSLNVVPGAKPITITLAGANLNLVTSAVLVSNDWPVKGTKVILGRTNPAKRGISFYADSTVKPIANCQLRLTADNQVINVPVKMLNISVGGLSEVATPTIKVPEVPTEVYEPAYSTANSANSSGGVYKSISNNPNPDTMVQPKDAASSVGNVFVEIGGLGNMSIFEFHLEVNTDVIEYEESDMSRRRIRKKPGMTNYSEITFVRQFDDFSKNSLYPWWKSIERGDYIDRKSGSIIFFNESGEEYHRINFYEAWPCRIESRYVYYNNRYVIMEEVSIVTEKIELDAR